jgi:transposase
MRPKGTPEELEKRRRSVVSLLRQNLSLHEIARRLGCNASSVLRWRDTMKRGGTRALKAKPAEGRPCRLTKKQKTILIRVLIKGAVANGYRTDLWTTSRIAEVIEKQFHVHYHRNHVGKLLHQLGWSPQKPERRSIQRDEIAIDEWKRIVWPAVKKTPLGWQPISFSLTNRASSSSRRSKRLGAQSAKRPS